MNTKHSYKITTVIWGFVLLSLIADLTWTIMHPRPTRFLWGVTLLYFAIKIFRERNSETCIWRQEYKKQKKQAEEAGISYQESRRVVRTPKSYIIEIPLLLFLVSVFLYFPNALWPYHARWEYKGEIAHYKNREEKLKQEFGEDYYKENFEGIGEKYKIFPDAIPREAGNVKWYAWPGAGQARERIYLSMKMPMEYIQDTIKHYAPSAEILHYTEEDDEDPDIVCGWWDDENNIGCDSFPGIDYEDKQAKNVVIYLLSDDCNYETGYGFWVNEQENVICFFALGRS